MCSGNCAASVPIPHSCVYERFIYFQDMSTYCTSCSRIGKSIVGIHKLLSTGMRKLGLWPRNFFSGNICLEFFGIGSLQWVPMWLNMYSADIYFMYLKSPADMGDRMWLVTLIPPAHRERAWRIGNQTSQNNSAGIEGPYDNPILTRFLSPIECSKIPAQAYAGNAIRVGLFGAWACDGAIQ